MAWKLIFFSLFSRFAYCYVTIVRTYTYYIVYHLLYNPCWDSVLQIIIYLLLLSVLTVTFFSHLGYLRLVFSCGFLLLSPISMLITPLLKSLDLKFNYKDSLVRIFIPWVLNMLLPFFLAYKVFNCHCDDNMILLSLQNIFFGLEASKNIFFYC